MKLSAQEAAERLGVSRMQISRLVANGEIAAERFGRALAIDVDSLNRYADLRPPRGRPLPPDSAWEAVERVARRDRIDVGELARLAVAVRRRARRNSMRVMPARLEAVLLDDRVVVSGADAAAAAGAPVRPRDPRSIYVRRSDFAGLVDDHRIRVNHEAPNLIVRVADDDAPVFSHGHHASLAVAALDLVDERDERSAAEALR